MPKTQKKSKSRAENTLNDLLLNKIKALYDVENQLIKALPKMAKNATDPDLKRAFEKHFRQTEGHAQRLERAFGILGERPQKLAGDAIRGLIADGDWVIKNVKGDTALDANLIAAAQYVEHYEMAGYQSAIEWAKRVDQGDIADLFQETLDEEKETSEELTDLAESKINEQAMGKASNLDAEDEVK